MSLTTSEQPRANKFGVGKFLQGGTPGEGMCLPWRRPFQNVKNP